MHLINLVISNFKNYAEVNVEFSSKINVLVGRNGSGKTNLLDAIYFLSITKSAFQADQYLVKTGENVFFLKGIFEKEKRKHEVTAAMQQGAKKIIREDGAEYQKMSDHIGKYPVVMIAPDDVALIREGSEVRRRFIDTIISQLDRHYLENLVHYNHALKQRNSLLTMFYDSGRTDLIALESYDQVLIARGAHIFERRKAFLVRFQELFISHFNFLVDQAESAAIQYSSGLDAVSFEEGLLKSRQKDLDTQRTNFGIHRDDFLFTINQAELRRMGSQGQQKSFVIALKLAQWELVKETKGLNPIILLDDVFDKLDDIRINKLLDLIRKDFGQLFVTDARPDRTRSLFKDFATVTNFLEVRQGNIKRMA